MGLMKMGSVKIILYMRTLPIFYRFFVQCQIYLVKEM